jgi:membrane protease subunit (stomatin/prohibitin family)
LIREIVGTDGRFTLDEISSQLRSLIVSRFSEVVGQSGIPVLEIAANYGAFGNFVAEKIGPQFETFGIALTKLIVENISLPPEVEAALDKRTSMGVIGNLAAYTQFNVANSLPDAARNPGGLAAAGAGVGLGIAMAQPIGQALSYANARDNAPPIPGTEAYFVAVDGKQSGPFDVQALQSQVSLGQLTRESLVWTKGMPGWSRAGEVATLAPVFANVPPPVPPKS